jgi:hypothetical protein
MGTWIKDTLTTGAVATASTTAAVAVLGNIEGGSATAPINAVSHILWGDSAATKEQFDARHTLAGAGINAVAVTGWAGLHQLFMPRKGRASVQRAVLAGVVTAAVAYVTDYHVVPNRFTPGFEKRLSSSALFGVYATLALSLAAGSLCRKR